MKIISEWHFIRNGTDATDMDLMSFVHFDLRQFSRRKETHSAFIWRLAFRSILFFFFSLFLLSCVARTIRFNGGHFGIRIQCGWRRRHHNQKSNFEIRTWRHICVGLVSLIFSPCTHHKAHTMIPNIQCWTNPWNIMFGGALTLSLNGTCAFDVPKPHLTRQRRKKHTCPVRPVLFFPAFFEFPQCGLRWVTNRT